MIYCDVDLTLIKKYFCFVDNMMHVALLTRVRAIYRSVLAMVFI